MSPNSSASFWTRMGLREEDRDVCVRAIQSLYPESRIEEIQDQGYCSFTLRVSPSTLKKKAEGQEYVVQVRPQQHSLDLTIANAAHKTHGNLSPSVRDLACTLPGGLRAVEMQLMPGVPLSKLTICNGTWEQRVKLIETLAEFIALAWPASTSDPPLRCAPPIFPSTHC